MLIIWSTHNQKLFSMFSLVPYINEAIHAAIVFYKLDENKKNSTNVANFDVFKAKFVFIPLYSECILRVQARTKECQDQFEYVCTGTISIIIRVAAN